MATNPVALIIPCHRVLAAGGKVGGFSAPGGSAAKIRMLALEGVHLERRHRHSSLSGFDGGKASGDGRGGIVEQSCARPLGKASLLQRMPEDRSGWHQIDAGAQLKVMFHPNRRLACREPDQIERPSIVVAVAGNREQALRFD